MTKAKTTKEEPLEKQLWKAADKLRKNIDAARIQQCSTGLDLLKIYLRWPDYRVSYRYLSSRQ